MRIVSKGKYIVAIIISIIIVTLIISVLNVPVINQVVKLLFISFIFAYILKPLNTLLVRKGVNRKIASTIIVVGLLTCILLVFIIVIPSIFMEGLYVNMGIEDLEKYLLSANKKIKVLETNKVMSNIITNGYQKLNTQIPLIFDNIFISIMSIGENFITYMVSPLIIYYFLSDSEHMINKVLRILPPEGRNVTRKIIKDIDKVLGRYIISQLILCVIITIFTFLILFFMKIKFPLILSLINGVFNIIPYFGPIFGVIPAILIALLISPKTALYTALWLFALQQIEGSVLSPKIIGDSISMHPLTVILLLIIGGGVSGILGMIVAVPLGVVIKVIYEDLNYYLF